MLRRALTLASALAVSTAALAAAAPAASAADTCNTTTGGVFNGTTICVHTEAVITGYTLIPYSIGSICVGNVCTVPVSGYIQVPNVNLNAAYVYGQVCVTVKTSQICVPYTTQLVLT